MVIFPLALDQTIAQMWSNGAREVDAVVVLMCQQLMAEQQEEYISNTLLKKIEALKNEKEQLARNYEQEEEYLTNDLSRKLLQVSISVNCY